MYLADLCLSEIPDDALRILKSAITIELKNRRKRTGAEKTLINLKSLKFDTISFSEATQEIIRLNSEYLLGLPPSTNKYVYHERVKYLPCLLGQDWDILFSSADASDQRFYVYAHLDPRGQPLKLDVLNVVLHGKPFYIGKGTGNRAFDLKRNQGHGKYIKLIRDAGFEDSSIVSIISDHLTEREALSLEAKLIYLFGSIYEDDRKGCLLNLADHIRPNFVDHMRRLPVKRQCKKDHRPNGSIAITQASISVASDVTV